MNRIKALRREKDISQATLAAAIGVHQTAISQWETGRTNPDVETAQKLAAYFAVNLGYLLGSEEMRTNVPMSVPAEQLPENVTPTGTAPRRRVPKAGKIADGKPVFSDGESVELGADIDADFYLRMEGNSMVNARICDGDLVFVKRVPTVEHGDIAAVVIGDRAALKRVYYYPERSKLVLASENARCEPLVYIGQELAEVRILGKAVAFLSEVR